MNHTMLNIYSYMCMTYKIINLFYYLENNIQDLVEYAYYNIGK